MSNETSIEWTSTINPDGTITKGASWNPVTGCTKVSPGCDHCYAETFAERFRGVPGHPYEQGFDLRLWPERLDLPRKWKTPKKIFVNSMSDLFHKDVPDAFILQVFETMFKVDHHIYQVLTKRPGRLARMEDQIISHISLLNGRYTPWPAHIWLGTSIESQKYVWRADYLRRVSCQVRFISAEPLLGALDLNLSGIHWLITGAESGHGARLMDEDWVRSLRDQAVLADTRFFYKQNARNGHKLPLPALDGKVWNEYPGI